MFNGATNPTLGKGRRNDIIIRRALGAAGLLEYCEERPTSTLEQNSKETTPSDQNSYALDPHRFQDVESIVRNVNSVVNNYGSSGENSQLSEPLGS
jgi:hypothetical protein